MESDEEYCHWTDWRCKQNRILLEMIDGIGTVLVDKEISSTSRT